MNIVKVAQLKNDKSSDGATGNIKFLVKIKKTVTVAHAIFKEVYGYECLSSTQVFEWLKRLKGRETTIAMHALDDPTPQKRTKSFQNFCQSIRDNHRLSIQAVAELTEIDKESIRQIFS